MSGMVKRWYRSRKYQSLLSLVGVVIVIYYLLSWRYDSESQLDMRSLDESFIRLRNRYKVIVPMPRWFRRFHYRQESVNAYIESKLQEAMKEEKGAGCEMPKLDPFAKEIMQFETDQSKIECQGNDWVKCYLSECRVVKEILDTTKNIECTYRDILYRNDRKYEIGPPTVVKGDSVHTLVESDHVKISCTGKHIDSTTRSPNSTDYLSSRWRGHAAGIRKKIKRKPPPKERESTPNVLILGFDSTSHNGFIRRMPRSYRVLRDELRATILKSFNIVGDGTPASLFPILTGKTELELPECRKSLRGSGYLDSMPFIFYKLYEDGYRTAYLEDMPGIGTFQYRFNGFMKQPADHYLRAFLLEESKSSRSNKYCLGDTPQFKIMLNLTDQFFKLSGKRFGFTFIADITHDDFNVISAADDDVVDFLRAFKSQGRLRDTLLIVMGDHGPRYSNVRNTMQGRFEERLPLMAIRLPDDLKVDRPDAQNYLNSNVDVLTTPHDIYATIMDVIEMTEHWNPYKVKGSDLPRGMTLLETIPHNRSCSEAGIEPHWCACVNWRPVRATDPMYHRTANAVVDYINGLTASLRSKCAPRTLSSIMWVTRQHVHSRLVQFKGARDEDGYVGKFDPKAKRSTDNYQVKVSVGPGNGVYEASLIHYTQNDTLVVDAREISRISAYSNEPACISNTHPHLNKYCYCYSH